VAIQCGNGHVRQVRPESLIQRFGRDFDLYTDDPGFAQLLEAFPCCALDGDGQPPRDADGRIPVVTRV
jgi:hypothetical protein